MGLKLKVGMLDLGLGGRLFLQRGSPPLPPWRLPPDRPTIHRAPFSDASHSAILILASIHSHFIARREPAGSNSAEAPECHFPIVGVGASAGGLEAFTQLLQNLPNDTGMAFVLVQHLDPAHASALTQLLSKATSLPVREVTNDLPVKPNHVYVIPPNATLTLANGS